MTATQQQEQQSQTAQQGGQQNTVQVVNKFRNIASTLAHTKELVQLRLLALQTRTSQPGYRPSEADMIEQGDVSGRMATLDFSIDQVCDALGTNLWEILSQERPNGIIVGQQQNQGQPVQQR